MENSVNTRAAFAYSLGDNSTTGVSNNTISITNPATSGKLVKVKAISIQFAKTSSPFFGLFLELEKFTGSAVTAGTPDTPVPHDEKNIAAGAQAGVHLTTNGASAGVLRSEYVVADASGNVFKPTVFRPEAPEDQAFILREAETLLIATNAADNYAAWVEWEEWVD